MIPFVTPKIIKVPPSDITMSSPFWMGGQEQVEKELAKMKQKQGRAYYYDADMGGLLSLPFRQAAFWLGVGLTAAGKAFTSQGLLQFHVKGHNVPWKLEHMTAWALDEGQALDKMVKVKIA